MGVCVKFPVDPYYEPLLWFMILNMDCFKDFQIRVTLMNWWSIVQVDVTETIENLTITYHKNSILLFWVLSNLDQKCMAFAYSYLSTKFGVFPSKFKGDMHKV